MGRDDDEILDLWSQVDRDRVFLPSDAQVIAILRSVHASIVGLLHEGPPGRDVFHGCATLGRVIAMSGGSPTFAASALDGLELARSAFINNEIFDHMPRWIHHARAAVVEGYVAGLNEQAMAAARSRWEYPACVVQLSRTRAAILAGFPDPDQNRVTDWAGRVASAAARDGFREVDVAGDANVTKALTDAFSLIGVKVTLRSHDSTPTEMPPLRVR